jgi:hypothetical protein
MNVFILSTGRCGSTTFARACGHVTNYTAGHETRWRRLGPGRLAYPPNHIECDNRLAWLLGRLDERYGDAAFYVHLTRDRAAVAASFDKRWGVRGGIIAAYGHAIIHHHRPGVGVCADYWDTVNSNIRLFLKDKTRTLDVRLEHARDDFRLFWDRVGAVGDLEAALREWDMKHNASA